MGYGVHEFGECPPYPVSSYKCFQNVERPSFTESDPCSTPEQDRKHLSLTSVQRALGYAMALNRLGRVPELDRYPQLGCQCGPGSGAHLAKLLTG